MTKYFSHATDKATPILPIEAKELKPWLAKQSVRVQQWAESHRFEAKPDTALVIPAAKGGVERVLAGCDGAHIWSIAQVPQFAPSGSYKIEAKWSNEQLADAALGFALAQYQFTRYKKIQKKTFSLTLPKAVDIAAIERKLNAINLVRDLINTPTNDMAPEDLALAAQAVAKQVGAKFAQIIGDELLKQNYPAIHAVGRAANHRPRLLRLEWGNPKDPLVALVGKGVCFDTGGLDLKPYNAMKLMKKDMGGAALMLGLLQLVAQEKLPVRLLVLLPVVENAIDSDSYRPQDIIPTRKGLTMEIGSTDAEGRVILADALTAAESMKPEIIIDAATLTGAARTALGTELPALYSNRDDIARELVQLGTAQRDPMWHMPLWAGYDKYVNSQIADITNSPNYGFAGSITAALFLQRFVSPKTAWVHLDTYAWNGEPLPGRPQGGEALTLRTLFAYLEKRFTS